MPNARPSRRPHVALALSLASALFASAALALPRETAHAASTAAAACPVEPPPTPLRTLYRASERIAAARVGESVALEGKARQNMRRTTFVATESIKGDPGEKSFFVYHPVWPSDANYVGNFRKGETLLLFLRRAEDVEPAGYYVTDIRHGAKRLSEADLKIYFKRIEELQWVTRQQPLDRAELLEWLVRCVEEPATRWEGAFELAYSAQLAAYEAESAREKAHPVAAQIAALPLAVGGGKAEGEDANEDAGESVAGVSGGPDEGAEQAGDAVAAEASEESAAAAVNFVEDFSVSSEVEVFNGPDVDSKLIGELTAAQKERLAGALYSADKVGEGEMQLVYVVENWDGARLTPFVVRHLQKLQDNPPYDAERLMHVLARVLKDDRLTRLAEMYTEKAPYDDDSVETEEEAASAESEEADSTDAEASEAEGEEEAEEEAEQQADSGEAEEIMAGALVTQAGGARPTASQVRGRMLHNFLAAVEKRMNAAAAETAQR
ncbi:MAG TPA: hypothetical protein VF240_21215 [Pyrinomonadaceae bacterium]